MSKVITVKINKCGECPRFVDQSQSEPSFCNEFPIYSHLVRFSNEPPSFCPLSDFEGNILEKMEGIKIHERKSTLDDINQSKPSLE